MKSILIVILLSPLICFSQGNIEKGVNTIHVADVSFNQVVDRLLDAGYYIEKIDSNFQTIKTEFKNGGVKNKLNKFRLFIRVKDSLAIITGQFYNTYLLGTKLFGVEQTIENSTNPIANKSGNQKSCFNEMNTFAMSFNKPTTYSISK
ncbi:MAG: hypothetical protein IPI78_02440 [Chitinophagaceae bacterium]|nr:hypothetical protein [Chitinophagaceae bacterium]